jgi:hypothetical protein
MPRRRFALGRPWLWAALCAAAGFLWQAATVTSNYGGNWTALFCTGSTIPVPATLASEHVYVFPDSPGYDGQLYHYVAHDPLYRGQTGHAIPDPETRYRRILFPALAWALAAGRQAWIDWSYILLNLLFLAAGAWWLARYLEREKRPAAWSLLYLLAPATLISLDRLTIDLTLVSLTLGFVLYSAQRSDAKLYTVLVAAGLCRETGLLLTAAISIEEWLAGRRRRAIWFATAAAPALLWNVYVHFLVPPASPYEIVPGTGIVDTLLHPAAYRLVGAAKAAVLALDYAAWAGILLSMALAFRNLRRPELGPMRFAAPLWAVTALLMPRSVWADAYAAGRVFTPLLAFSALAAAHGGSRLGFLPLALAAPRVWVQLGPQALGILRAHS